MRQESEVLGNMRNWRAARRFTLIAALAVLSGCASLATDPRVTGSPAQRQQAVAERAEARWQALIKGDVEGAYAFLSPGSKAATSLALYKSKIKPGIWRAAKVDSVSCEGDVCNVKLTITYDMKRMKDIETQLAESWIIENGAAWYVYR